MSNKIDGFGQQPAQVSGGRRDEAVKRVDGENAGHPRSVTEDQVTLTDSARQLQRLSEEVAAAPELDTARVAALRQAIERGEYQVDARRVADRMLALEHTLAGL
ncbi:MAG: flagellar biosynthesis anti-sigma factor FlgM [Gammaproteobacteria bacterium]|nr:MAG: flagellar biosynthesis anti-sigma factor FlgM [Gammaproteobacteria bacterium]